MGSPPNLSQTHTIKSKSTNHQFKGGRANGKPMLNQSTAYSFHTKCSLSYYKFQPLITALICWSTSLQPVYTQPQHTAATAIHIILSKEKKNCCKLFLKEPTVWTTGQGRVDGHKNYHTEHSTERGYKNDKTVLSKNTSTMMNKEIITFLKSPF